MNATKHKFNPSSTLEHKTLRNSIFFENDLSNSSLAENGQEK